MIISKKTGFLALSLVAASIVHALLSTVAVSAADINLRMSDISPSRGYAINSNGNTNQTNHTMILSEYGVVERIRIALYYPNAGAKQVTINSGGTVSNNPAAGEREICRIYNAREFGGASKRHESNPYLIVRFRGSNGEEIRYRIDGDKMCNTSAANNGLTMQEGQSNDGQARLFGTYDIPGRVLSGPRDEETNNQFIKVDMAIAWADESTSVGSNILWHRSGGDQRFQFRVNSPGGLTGSLAASTIAAARNYSFAGRGNSENSDPVPVLVRQHLPFGRPCGSNDAPNQRVTLYDADNVAGRTGVVFYVAEVTGDGSSPGDIRPLDWDEYRPGNFRGGNPSSYPEFAVDNSTANYQGGADIVWAGTPNLTTPRNGGYPMFRPGNYSNRGGSMSIAIKDMKGNGAHYALVVRNILRNGETGANNFLYAGLPGDGIFGNSNFNCPPPAQPNLTPFAGFNEAFAVDGEPVTGTARIVNGGSSAVPNVTYARDIWYSPSADWMDKPAGSVSQFPYPRTGTDPAIPPGTRTLPDQPYTANAAFSYICTRLTITSMTSQPTAGQCIPIGKYPNLAVLNGDARAGGTVPNAGCSLNGTGGDGAIIGHAYGIPTKGSLSQYGALGRGVISNFGSASIPSSSGALTKQLLFGAGTAYSPPLTGSSDGYFYRNRTNVEQTVGHCLPDLSGVYPSGTATTVVPAGQTRSQITYTSVNHTFTFAQNAAGQTSTVTLAGVTLGPNQRVGVRVNGPADCSRGQYIVRITNNITRGPTPIGSIPWFSLITTGSCVRIVVNDNVSSLYGLYASEGSIATCAGFNGNGFDNTAANQYSDTPLLNSNACNLKLTFNGAVIAGTQLYPYRTYGNGTYSDAAETFNLDPAFTISDYNRSRQSSIYRVDSQLELPPRF